MSTYYIRNESREQQQREFLAAMEKVYQEQEKEYIRIRKLNYWRIRNEVKRGLRSSLELLEFEIWAGW